MPSVPAGTIQQTVRRHLRLAHRGAARPRIEKPCRSSVAIRAIAPHGSGTAFLRRSQVKLHQYVLHFQFSIGRQNAQLIPADAYRRR